MHKTHKTLSKSPVTYVLAQIRISPIANMEEYIRKLQDDIRHLFPHFKPFNIQTVQFRDNQNPETFSYKQWHFIDKENCTGIILDDKSISIHTSKYNSFKHLKEKFCKVLDIFHKRLKIDLFVKLGLRYVNFFKSDNIDSYTIPNLRGIHFDNDKFFQKNKFITKMETTQLSKRGIIKVQSSYIGNQDVVTGVKNIFVPPDLADVANLLSFEHHQLKRDTTNFLLLDIDHFSEKQTDNEFNVDKIINAFDDLEKGSYAAFRETITKEALAAFE